MPQEILADSLQPDMMSVGLIRQDTIGYAMIQNYLVQDNLCAGSLTLPPRLRAGSYELVAALNLLEPTGKPRFVFRKRITIQTLEQPPFFLSFQIDSSISSDMLHISVQALPTDPTAPIKKSNFISYHRPGNKTQTQKLDISGRATLKIHINKSDTTLPVLYTVTNFNGQSIPYSVWLPVQKKIMSMRVCLSPLKGWTKIVN
ncbi:hypothetical protein ABDK00_009345 [Niabella insulamsoli]|uniref:hypothetical protein n=1 Tax=Niabella insulamsoli TaxID=3144874 RepID=UPI0031FE2381